MRCQSQRSCVLMMSAFPLPSRAPNRALPQQISARPTKAPVPLCEMLYGETEMLEEGISAKSVKRPVARSASRSQPFPMFTGPQCRAARGLLGWSVAQLAQAAGVAWRTIQRAEASEGVPRMHIATLEKIQAALEAAGVEFIQRSNSGVGVRLRR
jgi:hypothetical protein